MLNLRQLNSAEATLDDSQHFSRFSHPMFRNATAVLGNIGEHLEHIQAERHMAQDNEENQPSAEAYELDASLPLMNADAVVRIPSGSLDKCCKGQADKPLSPTDSFV